jgi:hypothetical protein
VDQFDPVAEGVGNVTAPDAGDCGVLDHFHAGDLQSRGESVVVDAAERRMRLPGRTKLGLDAEMDLDDSALKPASATLLEFGGFLNFDHAQQSSIKGAGMVFLARRHSQLHVVDRTEWEVAHAMILSVGIREQVHLPGHFSAGSESRVLADRL